MIPNGFVRGFRSRSFVSLNLRPIVSIHGPGSLPPGCAICGVGALIQRGGRAVAGMLTIATAGGS